MNNHCNRTIELLKTQLISNAMSSTSYIVIPLIIFRNLCMNKGGYIFFFFCVSTL